MLSRSISSTLALAMAQARARCWICGNSASRVAAVSCLESFSPRRPWPGGRITAAANTGPARQPRPASSTPAISRRGSEAGAADMPTACLPGPRISRLDVAVAGAIARPDWRSGQQPADGRGRLGGGIAPKLAAHRVETRALGLGRRGIPEQRSQRSSQLLRRAVVLQ